MRSFPLLLLSCHLANALKNPMGVAVAASVIPNKTNNKNSSDNSGSYALPPMEVLVKFDFDVVPTRHKKENKVVIPPTPSRAPVSSKKIVTRPPSPPLKVKNAVVIPPPPPKKTNVFAVEKQANRSLPQLAVPKVMAQQPKKLSEGSTQRKVSTGIVKDQKIAKIMWTTLLLVMMDLLLFCNTDVGKDFLIGSLDVLPEQVPVQLLVLAISNGFLLVSIFAVCLVATIGPLLAETAQWIMSQVFYRSRRNNTPRQITQGRFKFGTTK
jgi:hypothetical protein